MRFSKLAIKNFRNFAHLDIPLNDHIVIVGENKVGKSNLIYALRLLLDPTLPDSARRLRDEDFWDGLARPLAKEDYIEISLELTDFENNPNQLTLLSDYCISHSPMVAKLTYIYQPRPQLDDEPTSEADYEFLIYGGDNPSNKVGFEIRNRLPLDVMHALRDAESDLAKWARSPLKPLLDQAAMEISREQLTAIADEISEANARVVETTEIKNLADGITSRLVSMVGSTHALETAIGFAPTNPEKLIRSLRLFIDGRERGIEQASLGSSNLLYLALKTLHLEQLIGQKSRDHTFLSIEEPEAHLHPHVQRLVYRHYLRPPEETPSEEEIQDKKHKTETTVILTTHSPHIVSVTPLRAFISLRSTKKGASYETIAASTANLDLSEPDIADLERYLDVTRGEMLFARGVLLVEGEAEKYLIPVLSKLLRYDLDELGISVCSVSGTNFLPYVKLLGDDGLKIPYAVITDYDPKPENKSLGIERVRTLLEDCDKEYTYVDSDKDVVIESGEEFGFFLNEYTFEIDLFRAGRHISMCETLIELTDNGAIKKRATGWKEDPLTLDPIQFLKDIKPISKGRYAQRLATNLQENKKCPAYIKKAIEYVVSLCHPA